MPRWMIAFVPLGLLAGCAPKAAPTSAKELPPVSVTVAQVQDRAYQQRVIGTGTLNGTEDLALALKVDGRIRAIHYDVGDPALPGAVLL